MSSTVSSVSPGLLEKMNPQKEENKNGLTSGLGTPGEIQDRFLTMLLV